MTKQVNFYEGSRFWLAIVGLVALLVLMPVAASRVMDMDARTPMAIALDTLHADYGLVPVDANGAEIPKGAPTPTVSEFSILSGATTTEVPFRQHGKPVVCTVSVPDDPASVTATCAPKSG
jgi:hypothetical protein